MKNNKNGLDEMQRERRNSIGNQMFMLMFYSLFINSGLYSAGIRWLDYPGNVMVISTVCMGIYLVRLIALNAYLPPKAQSRKNVIILAIAIVFSVVLAISAINLFGHSSTQLAENTTDNPALILMIASSVGLLITLIVAIIKKVNGKDIKDE